jgi:CHASE2 domain-containing sensor protein
MRKIEPLKILTALWDNFLTFEKQALRKFGKHLFMWLLGLFTLLVLSWVSFSLYWLIPSFSTRINVHAEVS